MINSTLPPLHIAVCSGDAVSVGKLLAQGAPVSQPANISKDERRMTPLHLAAKLGFRDILPVLIDGGADLHALSKIKNDRIGFGYRSVLDVAAEYGHKEVVELLLSTAINFNEEAILHFAVKSENIELVDFVAQRVIAKGDKLDYGLGHAGDTPAHIAARMGNIDIIKMLGQYGANLLEDNEEHYEIDEIADLSIRDRVTQLIQPLREKVWREHKIFEEECKTAYPKIISFLKQRFPGDEIPFSEIQSAVSASREVVMDVLEEFCYTRDYEIVTTDGVAVLRLPYR